MHYVSLIVEFLRGRPPVMFWTAALAQAALWVIVPSLFYSSPPGQLPDVLAVGHEFRLGSQLGPPLSFWLADLAYMAAGAFGVYLLAQACIVVGFWAVFALGRRIVGTRHAAIAVLLMVGITALSVQSPDFGPAILAVPLWALALLHYWRAAGEGERGMWFLFAIDLGLLLLASYTGVMLLVLVLVFSGLNDQTRAAFRHPEPWLALLFVLFVAAPHLLWIWNSLPLAVAALGEEQSDRLATGVRVGGFIIAVHLGLGIMVALASGWPRRRRLRPPEIERHPAPEFGRLFLYFFALMPTALALALAFGIGRIAPLEQPAPLVLLSGLAIVALAGDRITLYRERYVSFAWLGLLTLPPAFVVVGLVVLPWLGVDLKTAQPAGEMGRFFADSFMRRTGRPLTIVSGDTRVAELVALGAPQRPLLYRADAPELSPSASAEQLRGEGGILVWPATDTAGAPPAALKARFPELVPELPRVFERRVEGRLPLMRIGWAVIRPAATPARK
jgi:Dolichyl-phosphate-mannose-protein mannosyltransferase